MAAELWLFVALRPVTLAEESIVVLFGISVLVVVRAVIAPERLLYWEILEIKSCSRSRSVLDALVSVLKVVGEVVDTNCVEKGFVEQVLCFGFIGMQVRLPIWKIGAFSRRALGIASRLP